MIGEEHYCAEILENDNWFEREQMVIVCKSINPDEERSQIVSIIIRITAQLAELSLSFKKFQNTRVIYLDKESVTFSFYYYNQHFYVVQSSLSLKTMANFLLEITQIGEIIRTILEDMHLPLFRAIPKLSDEELYEDMLHDTIVYSNNSFATSEDH